MPRLKQIMKWVAVLREREGSTSRRGRLPVTPNILRRMRALWLPGSKEEGYSHVMLWAVSCVTFFTFSHSGEMTVPEGTRFDPRVHLDVQDISVDREGQPRVVSIRLKKSKTDQEGRGATLIFGRTGNELCPVSVLIQYIKLRGTKPGPLFQWKDGTPLSCTRFVGEVQKVLLEAGLPARRFTGHSFRIWASTTAATLGVEDSTIQTLGRWKSSAFLSYIRLGTGQLASMSKVLAQGDM
uniref:Tyr recombinase domain-containing protein n=1 Tax=Amphimedon queenslandica TaxID=400682 RepID=A0A1X7V7M6_AMPQE